MASIARSGAKPGHRVRHAIQVPERYCLLVDYVMSRIYSKGNGNLNGKRSVIRKILKLLKEIEKIHDLDA